MQERILAELRRLGREEADSLLAFAAERSVSMMQAYCGRKELSEGLLGVGVALAGRLLDSGAMDCQGMKSVKEGDVSVTFAAHRTEAEILTDFQTELNRFRKMDW